MAHSISLGYRVTYSSCWAVHTIAIVRGILQFHIYDVILSLKVYDIGKKNINGNHCAQLAQK